MELLRCLSANKAVGAFAARLIPRHRCLVRARHRGLLQAVVDAGSSAASPPLPFLRTLKLSHERQKAGRLETR
jgi:hypothetical protein